MNSMTAEQLAEVKAAVALMTPGPWTRLGCYIVVANGGGNKKEIGDGKLGAGGVVCDSPFGTAIEENFSAIVLLRNHADALIAAAEREQQSLEAELASRRESVQNLALDEQAGQIAELLAFVEEQPCWCRDDRGNKLVCRRCDLLMQSFAEADARRIPSIHDASLYVEARIGSENHRGRCIRVLWDNAHKNEEAEPLLRKILGLLHAAESDLAAIVALLRPVLGKEPCAMSNDDLVHGRTPGTRDVVDGLSGPVEMVKRLVSERGTEFCPTCRNRTVTCTVATLPDAPTGEPSPPSPNSASPRRPRSRSSRA